MSENAHPTWYHRTRGLIDQVVTPGDEDMERTLRRSAILGRYWRGEPLSDADRAELATLQADRAADSRKGDPRYAIGGAEEKLGFLAFVRPELLRQLDALAVEIAEAVAPAPGMGEQIGWDLIRWYATGAHQAVMDERLAATAEQRRISAEQNARAAETQEGQRGLAALQTPDDGPEGWSTVAPAHADFPHAHPLQGQLLSHLRAKSEREG